MIKARAPYTARVYARAKDNDLLANKLRGKGLTCALASIRDFASNKLVSAVEVKITYLKTLPHVVREIERLGSYGYRIYNADIDPAQTYLFENDLNPLCVVECDIQDGWVRHISKIVDCEDPDFTTCEIRLETEYSPLIDFDARINTLFFNETAFSGPEPDILDSLIREYESYDPDVVVFDHGDSYGVDYLLHRFQVHGKKFELGREPSNFRRKDTRRLISYGRIVKRPPAHYLKGRYLIDSSNFLYREGGLDGVCELARLTYMPVQKVARLSPGAAITNLQLYTAYRMGYGVPYKVNLVEDFKTGLELFTSDKGGFIFAPDVGFHTDVAEIDFASMYPHIMVNNNISGETVLCACCRERRVVPELGYHICSRRRGLTPVILEPIIERRAEYKRLYKKTGLKRYDSMQNVLKWILVTSFGYMGFRKSRFGRIEAHESVTAYARDVLLSAKEISEDAGFEIVHGIVDSLWIKKEGITNDQVDKLCRRIADRLSIPVKNEGLYRWIVFCPSVDRLRAPVPNRFYGAFKNGEVKARGIDVRRRDSPPIVNNMQEEMLEILAKTDAKTSFLAAVPECLRILRIYARRLKAGDFELDDLVIRKRISREKYKGSIPQKIVTDQLRKINFDKKPGDKISYVIRDAGNKYADRRYAAAETSDGKIDAHKYTELLVRSTESMLNFLGYDKKTITETLHETVQQKIWMY